MERLSVGKLRAKISGMLWERAALLRKPEALVKQDLAKFGEGYTLTLDLVFRDPYSLDFLELKHAYSEKVQEALLALDFDRS